MEEDRSASPASSSSREAAVAHPRRIRGRRRSEEDEDEDDGGDRAAACAGKRCQSCAAGAIADCVAVCCCPCAVVNFFTLAFVKLPWAVARRCIRRRRRKSRRRRRRMLEEEQGKWRDGDTDGISGKGRAEEGTSEIVLSLDELNDHFGAEDVWLQVYDEVGHLGFGRVSFTGIPFHNRGD